MRHFVGIIDGQYFNTKDMTEDMNKAIDTIIGTMTDKQKAAYIQRCHELETDETIINSLPMT